MLRSGNFRWLGLILSIASLLGMYAWEDVYQHSQDADMQELRKQQSRRFSDHIRLSENLLSSKSFTQQFKLRNFDQKIRTQLQKYEADMLVYSGDSLVFWSDNTISVDSCLSDIRSGTSVLKTRTGYYQVYKKQVEQMVYLLMFPIKKEITYSGGDYITRDLLPDVGNNEPVVVSLGSREGFIDVKDESGKYLYSEKINTDNRELPWYMHGLSLLAILIYWISIERWMHHARLKRAYWAMLCWGLGGGLLLRIFMISAGYPFLFSQHFLFGPGIYASSDFIPSLGDFLLHILFWIRVMYLFLVSIPEQSLLKSGSKDTYIKCLILFLGVWACVVGCQSLVNDSTIPFDIESNQINGFTLIGFTVPFLLFTGVYLLLRVLSKLLPGQSPFSPWMVWGIALVLWVSGWVGEWIPLHVMGFSLMLLLIQEGTQAGGLLRKSFLSLIISSVYTGLLIHSVADQKEIEVRKLAAVNLTEQTDSRAERILPGIDYRIANDPSLIRYFSSPFYSREDLSRRFRQSYFSGYLSRYDISIFDFDSSMGNFKYPNIYTFYELDSMYRKQAIPVGESHFARLRIPGPIQGYLAAFPVLIDSLQAGTLFVLLQPRVREEGNTLTSLLHQSKIDLQHRYDWAVYHQGRLFKSQGSYSYPVFWNRKVPVNEYSSLSDDGYDHCLYKGEPGLLVVVSKETSKWWKPFSYGTYFFTWFSLGLVMLLGGGILINLIRSLPLIFTGGLPRFWTRFYRLRKRDPFSGNVNLSLLSTRIQISIAALVLLTLVSTTLISQRSIRDKYSLQQRKGLLQKTREMAVSIGNTIDIKPGYYRFDDINALAVKYSETFRTDLNVFDVSGIMLISTQPRIFETGLLAGRMNPDALYALKVDGNSQFLHNEQIGNLTYLSAYVPIVRQEQVVAYLNLPYFTRNADLNEEIRGTISNLLQPFSFIFVVVSILSWLISSSFVEKLSIIRENLGRTVLGGRNSKIQWKSRDEIGELVKQYNIMIDKLSESAEMIARNERDSAWREMARQIAHEIKNPLTPMKLNVQQLQRAWQDQSPRLPETMDRVSKVLVEQIDALANLATEFSAFARLPESRLEKVNVSDCAMNVAQLFSGNEGLTLTCKVPEQPVYVMCGRDELLRILTNLVKNAVQAIPEDRLGVVHLAIQLKGREVEISVEDNGTGISDSLKNKIFEPNFSTKNSGMGLGLAMVRAMAEQAGGSVRYQSQSGKGTTFYVMLPWAGLH